MKPRALVRIACCQILFVTSSIAMADEYRTLKNIFLDGTFSADSDSLCARGNCLLNTGSPTSLVISDQKGQPIALSELSVPQATDSGQTTSAAVKESKKQRTSSAFASQAVHEIAPSVIIVRGVPWVQPDSEILDSQPGVDPHDVGCSPDDADESEDVAQHNPLKRVVKPQTLWVKSITVPSQVPSVLPTSYMTTGTQEFDWGATVPVSIPGNPMSIPNIQVQIPSKPMLVPKIPMSVPNIQVPTPSKTLPAADSPLSVDTLPGGVEVLPNQLRD